MSSVNKAILVGRLGKDPETRTLDNGAMVASFSIATSEKYKDKSGEKKEITDWHNVVLWRGLAEIAQKYLKKGAMVYIEGKIRTRMWEKNGQKHYITEIIGDNLTMLGGGSGSSSGQRSSDIPPPNDPQGHSSFGGANVENSSSGGSDDLPF